MKITTTIEVTRGELSILANALDHKVKFHRRRLQLPNANSNTLKTIAIELRTSEIMRDRIIKHLSEAPYIIREEKEETVVWKEKE